MNNKNLLIILILVLLFTPEIKENFIDRDLIYAVEPLLCDG